MLTKVNSELLLEQNRDIVDFNFLNLSEAEAGFVQNYSTYVITGFLQSQSSNITLT